MRGDKSLGGEEQEALNTMKKVYYAQCLNCFSLLEFLASCFSLLIHPHFYNSTHSIPFLLRLSCRIFFVDAWDGCGLGEMVKVKLFWKLKKIWKKIAKFRLKYWNYLGENLENLVKYRKVQTTIEFFFVEKTWEFNLKK